MLILCTPAKSVWEGLGVDILAVTPGYVAAGNTPRWTGGAGGSATPEEVARASLLVLPTALGPQLPPLLRQIPGDAVCRWLPESVLGHTVHSLHRGQRQRLGRSR